MLRTKFRENWPAGSGDEDFSRVFTVYGHGGLICHVTSIISTNFHFHEPQAYIQNLIKNGQVVSEKSMF